MLNSDELKHQKQAEEARKMHNFTVVRGAKLEVMDLGRTGVQIRISNPNQPEDCVTIQLTAMLAYAFSSWMQIYTAKHRGSADGKKGKKSKTEKEKHGGD